MTLVCIGVNSWGTRQYPHPQYLLGCLLTRKSHKYFNQFCVLYGQHKQKQKQEDACTHKTAQTHAGNVFVTRDLDL